MKGLLPLFFGLFATFAFSWVGLALIPNYQIGHLDPQTDEEGTDTYPMPQSGMAERGRRIFAANGCFYCHSQQLRPDYIASDLDRTRDFNKNQKWGVRRLRWYHQLQRVLLQLPRRPQLQPRPRHRRRQLLQRQTHRLAARLQLA